MNPFHFVGCFEVRELLGKKAADELKLMELLEEVPADSIYYHTHSYFLRHYYIPGLYPNDFANWAALEVRDRVLGEKLASVIPSPDKTLEDIREDLIEHIDLHLADITINPVVIYGEAFHFMTSRIIKVPTGISARNFQEFVDGLEKVDASAIFNHMFEARIRDRKGRSDFAIWLETSLGMTDLAERIEKIDSYMYSLEKLRGQLLYACRQEAGK